MPIGSMEIVAERNDNVSGLLGIKMRRYDIRARQGGVPLKTESNGNRRKLRDGINI
jgi:hypothetical protein